VTVIGWKKSTVPLRTKLSGTDIILLPLHEDAGCHSERSRWATCLYCILATGLYTRLTTCAWQTAQAVTQHIGCWSYSDQHWEQICVCVQRSVVMVHLTQLQCVHVIVLVPDCLGPFRARALRLQPHVWSDHGLPKSEVTTQVDSRHLWMVTANVIRCSHLLSTKVFFLRIGAPFECRAEKCSCLSSFLLLGSFLVSNNEVFGMHSHQCHKVRTSSDSMQTAVLFSHRMNLLHKWIGDTVSSNTASSQHHQCTLRYIWH